MRPPPSVISSSTGSGVWVNEADGPDDAPPAEEHPKCLQTCVMKGPPANKQRVQTGDKSRWKQLKILVLGDGEKLPDCSRNNEKRLLFLCTWVTLPSASLHVYLFVTHEIKRTTSDSCVFESRRFNPRISPQQEEQGGVTWIVCDGYYYRKRSLLWLRPFRDISIQDISNPKVQFLKGSCSHVLHLIVLPGFLL